MNSVIEHSRKTPAIGNTDQKKTIASILRPLNTSVAHKPTVTLRNTLMKVKDRIDAKTRKGTVYKVTCAECPATYFGETRRSLECRIKEHKRSTEKQDVGNRIAVHQMETKHKINWEGAFYIEFSVFEDERMFLESWFTKCDENSVNVCRNMPGAYAGLIA